MGAPDTKPERWHVGGLGRVITEPILGFFIYLESGSSTALAVEYRELGDYGKANSWYCFQDLPNPYGNNKFSCNLANTQKIFHSPEEKIFLSSALKIPAQAHCQFTAP